MTNLLITIVSIALFAIASILTISYGYDIFHSNKQKAEDNASMKQVQVIERILEDIDK